MNKNKIRNSKNNSRQDVPGGPEVQDALSELLDKFREDKRRKERIDFRALFGSLLKSK